MTGATTYVPARTEISVAPPNEFNTAVPAFNSPVYRGSGAKEISLFEASFMAPFPLIETVAVPFAPVLTVSPGNIVASGGAGAPLIETDSVELIEPID